MDILSTTTLQDAPGSTASEYAQHAYSRQFVHKKFEEGIDVCVHRFSFASYSDQDKEKYNTLLNDIKKRVEEHKKNNKVNALHEPPARSSKRGHVQYFSQNFHVQILEYVSGSFEVHLHLTKDCEVFKDLVKKMEEYSGIDPARVNHFSVLVKTQHGLGTRTITNGTHPLEDMNYIPEVMDGYSTMVRELQNEHPNGRLSILEGPPGTGKTFLIRNLPLVVPNSTFVVIPPSLISHLGSPEVVGSFLSIKDNLGEDCRTLTLVLEDADDCLQRRDGTNTSLVSSLLNSSSGILGEALNLRLVATSNLPKADIDEAILRPGRLGAYINVGALDEDTAVAVYRRLVVDDTANYDTKKHGMSLAEVYGAAAGSGKMNIKFNKKAEGRKIGFHTDNQDCDKSATGYP